MTAQILKNSDMVVRLREHEAGIKEDSNSYSLFELSDFAARLSEPCVLMEPITRIDAWLRTQ